MRGTRSTATPSPRGKEAGDGAAATPRFDKGTMIETQHLFKATIEVAEPRDLGVTPAGRRRIIDIVGGAFEGDRMRGRVLPGGADWQIALSDSVTFLEARYTIETDDGALIYVRNHGYRHGDPAVIARLVRGEPVDPSEYYFRTTPAFETSAPRYDWLNRRMFIATGARRAAAVELDVYEVT
jgi:hypothetical protein